MGKHVSLPKKTDMAKCGTKFNLDDVKNGQYVFVGLQTGVFYAKRNVPPVQYYTQRAALVSNHPWDIISKNLIPVPVRKALDNTVARLPYEHDLDTIKLCNLKVDVEIMNLRRFLPSATEFKTGNYTFLKYNHVTYAKRRHSPVQYLAIEDDSDDFSVWNVMSYREIPRAVRTALTHPEVHSNLPREVLHLSFGSIVVPVMGVAASRRKARKHDFLEPAQDDSDDETVADEHLHHEFEQKHLEQKQPVNIKVLKQMVQQCIRSAVSDIEKSYSGSVSSLWEPAKNKHTQITQCDPASFIDIRSKPLVKKRLPGFVLYGRSVEAWPDLFPAWPLHGHAVYPTQLKDGGLWYPNEAWPLLQYVIACGQEVGQLYSAHQYYVSMENHTAPPSKQILGVDIPCDMPKWTEALKRADHKPWNAFFNPSVDSEGLMYFGEAATEPRSENYILAALHNMRNNEARPFALLFPYSIDLREKRSVRGRFVDFRGYLQKFCSDAESRVAVIGFEEHMRILFKTAGPKKSRHLVMLDPHRQHQNSRGWHALQLMVTKIGKLLELGDGYHVVFQSRNEEQGADEGSCGLIGICRAAWIAHERVRPKSVIEPLPCWVPILVRRLLVNYRHQPNIDV